MEEPLTTDSEKTPEVVVIIRRCLTALSGEDGIMLVDPFKNTAHTQSYFLSRKKS